MADQEGDPESVLSFTRRVIALRKSSDDLAVGSYRSMAAPPRTWVFARGERTVVVINMSDSPEVFSGITGSIGLATDRAREGAEVEGSLTLAPWSGAVIES